MTVDIADTVRRGQVVAELDNDEYVQAVAQAKADLEVARPTLQRPAAPLRSRIGTSSESRLFANVVLPPSLSLIRSRRTELAKQAQLEVAEAQVTRAESSLETAKIRLGYTKITADWTSGDDPVS